jgi:transcription elongation factor GreA
MGPDESDVKKGIISVLSPVGQALLGKEEGDEILVEAPRGRIEYEIIAVTFTGSATQ